jgi:pSer/pThr/pTyr-binding forkhead associated (FHA) protein
MESFEQVLEQSSIDLRFQLIAPGYETKAFGEGHVLVGRNFNTTPSDIANTATYTAAVLSKRHAQFQCHLDKLYLTDLDSWHGTFIQSGSDPKFKLKPNLPYPILDGDIITFGKAVHKGRSVYPPVVVTVRLLRLRNETRISGRYGLEDVDSDFCDTPVEHEHASAPESNEIPDFSILDSKLDEDIQRRDVGTQTRFEVPYSEGLSNDQAAPVPLSQGATDTTDEGINLQPMMATAPTKKRKNSMDSVDDDLGQPKRFRVDTAGLILGAIAGSLATYAGLAFTEI